MDASNHRRSIIQKEFEILQREYSQLKVLNESLVRDLHSKAELMKDIELKQKKQIAQLKLEKYKQQEGEYIKIHQENMYYEELRTVSIMLDDTVKARDRTIEDRDAEIEELKATIKGLEKDLEDLHKEHDSLQVTSDHLRRKVKEL